MEVITNTTDFILDKPTAVAIGKFDGVHKGHKYLLDTLKKYQRNGIQLVIFTFDPPPMVYLKGEEEQALLTKEEKRKIFLSYGIDVLIEFPLNEETAPMEPEKFVEQILINQIQSSYIVAGEDISFGKQGKGDLALLEKMAKNYGFTLDIVDKVFINDEEVSSTRIRELLKISEVEEVEGLLGNPYAISGQVVMGNRQGKEFGFPTANLIIDKKKLVPKVGVYFTKVWIDNIVYCGISNLGYKPTIEGEKRLGLETHIYDYEQNIYGKEIKVEFLTFVRGEKKFSSINMLKEQVMSDLNKGMEYFKHSEIIS